MRVRPPAPYRFYTSAAVQAALASPTVASDRRDYALLLASPHYEARVLTPAEVTRAGYGGQNNASDRLVLAYRRPRAFARRISAFPWQPIGAGGEASARGTLILYTSDTHEPALVGVPRSYAPRARGGNALAAGTLVLSDVVRLPTLAGE